jgi:hypothetical protein
MSRSKFMVYRSTDNLLVYNGHFTNAEIGLAEIRPGAKFDVHFRFKANLTRGHYRAVIRIYDNIIQRFLAEACPPANVCQSRNCRPGRALRTWQWRRRPTRCRRVRPVSWSSRLEGGILAGGLGSRLSEETGRSAQAEWLRLAASPSCGTS